MRKYTDQEIQKKRIEKIVCNKCKKEIDVRNEIPREAVFEVAYRWGYFSNKDNEVHKFDLCEACYDEWISHFAIPVEKE